MPWIYAIVGLLVGCVVGVVIARLTTPQYKNQKSLQKRLENAQFALEQQRQELTDHFAQAAELLDTIGKDYTKLYQHLAEKSSDLLPNLPEQDNPFIKTLTKQDQKDKTEEPPLETPPKDYALGGTPGLFEKERTIEAEEVMKKQTE
jgi:uncharacterized membrane-anchored protein YhcB (DUF1043 family)